MLVPESLFSDLNEALMDLSEAFSLDLNMPSDLSVELIDKLLAVPLHLLFHDFHAVRVVVEISIYFSSTTFFTIQSSFIKII